MIIIRQHLLAMRVEAGVGEALSFILPEEPRITELDVVNLIARTLAVESVPVLLRRLTLPDRREGKREVIVMGRKERADGRNVRNLGNSWRKEG